ncbi:ribosomal protein S7 [Metschnikowia bicuspidata var. bicuspidata NRRL YB-4993]|uniref:Small ribosomal subunit protein uS7m n=1 Tax=Metschnikowia bicuspidata var. bicuspidata NRRL YB-4993 TaxID=869754 RepID=A0A1A0H795_9ASCO|nr:ribosomal protein S7 [Metschnikowia bicuspidata var. bicuspidata NRRL YB-4993]OBA19773.1 ribosomal protein S7 [Metschnikowia bicuspidata var. bicuspidata NRRL YB-4993]
MSMFRIVPRFANVARFTPRVSVVSFSRCQSTAAQIKAETPQTVQIEEPKIALTAKVFPLEKDQITEKDVDEWLKAVQTLKSGKATPETEAEVYLSQLAQPEEFLKEEFVPTEEQLNEVERYSNKSVPLPNDPVIENFTNLIMRDGKKERAQIKLSKALYIVYLKTRRDPVEVLYETLDKLGPLFQLKVKKTGTAKNRTVPFPLNRRQRNRYAILWIMGGAEKKKSLDFSVRLAEEIIGAYEGKSLGYEKKAQLHKMAITNRAYIEL